MIRMRCGIAVRDQAHAKGEMTSTDVPESPLEEFMMYSAENVIALMSEGDTVAAALDELTRAGFPRHNMYVLPVRQC
jgi:hypothetical protein